MSRKAQREKVFNRILSNGESRGFSIGYTVGHAFQNAGGYLTGEDIVKLSNKTSLEDLSRLDLIERFDKLSILTKEQREQMPQTQLKEFDRKNTVYVATSSLIKLYKNQFDPSGIFSKGNSLKHALRQKEIYMSLPVQQRQTFIGEKSVERLYKERLSDLKRSANDERKPYFERIQAFNTLQNIKQMRQKGEIQLVDFAYKSEDGTLTFGEVITANYTSKDIASKIAFVNALGYSTDRLTFYK